MTAILYTGPRHNARGIKSILKKSQISLDGDPITPNLAIKLIGMDRLKQIINLDGLPHRFYTDDGIVTIDNRESQDKLI